jgi:hypothetical protein
MASRNIYGEGKKRRDEVREEDRIGKEQRHG